MSRAPNLRSALRAYVRGHDRVWERRSKLGEGAEDADAEIEFGPVPAKPRFGVPVPEQLDFRRGPSADRHSDAGSVTHE